MRKFVRVILTMCLAVSMVSIVAYAEDAPPAKDYGMVAGKYMKPFSLPAPLEGDKIVKSETFNGKPTIIVFIQSACRICQFEVQHLNKAFGSIKDKVNVAVVFLDVDSGRIKVYQESFKIQSLVLHDATAEVAASVGISSSPATVLLDKGGKIIKIHSGYNEDALDDMFAQAKKL